MTVWCSVDSKSRYGIAIHNYFTDDGPHRLQLTVGETVSILKENGDWYYGYTSKNLKEKGIFPKSYIHLIECTVEKVGNIEIIQIKQQQIVQEVTAVLREWGSHWKHLYLTNSIHFEQIQKQIYELMSYRSKILSGTLPVDELKEIKQLVTSRIDTGNKLLNLDMVVRDDQGNILNPNETSTIQLYYQHKVATERIRKATSGPKKKLTKSVIYYSHIFFVSVRNFVCKMTEDAELLMTLYDAKENRAITENYVVKWSKEGLASDINQLHNLRVLFTDLGSRDLHREKVYLVCYVVRVGGMEAKEIDHRRSSVANAVTGISKKGHTDGMRRPFGVAAFDVTLYLCGKLESDDEKHHSVPFLQCCDKDNLDGTLKKILNNKELNNKGQSLWVSVKLLHGDIKQVREENPHLVLGNVAIARKMGFPEVILPGDVRNDLYLTLISGEFSKGSKSTDKNVEVTVRVCNEKGQSIPGVITMGGGTPPLNEYHSVIYYHEDRPKWYEIFKVAVPIDEFKASHLKFTFKHRSSNEAKDKSEKPFAMSYVRLMQENGTTLHDTLHELLVYKIDNKKFDETDLEYFKLPSKRSELSNEIPKPSCLGLSLSAKDNFVISTNVCSTKLTQNVDLLGLLNWTSHEHTLKDSLIKLMHVDGEEVVKFLQDVLDALFNILMQNNDSELFDNMVFQSLLYIIGLVSDRKYQHFQPVLDLYIQESFSATLAYDKLIAVLKYYVDTAANSTDSSDTLLLRAMKSLQYIIRFIVRSKILFNDLYGLKEKDSFETNFIQLLQSLTNLMSYATDSTLLVQGACLKFLPSTISDIILVFDPIKLSVILTDLLKKVPSNRLVKQKMMTVNDIIHSKLFLYPECRAVFLPVICTQVKELLESNEEVELCVKILSDIMELLFRTDVGSTMHDIKEIMLRILRTVIQTLISMDRENDLVGNLVAVMISIFRQMTAHHFEVYVNHFATRTDLLDFIMEIFMVFKDLVSSKTVYPSDWSEMILLQNFVILKSLRFFSHTTRDHFSDHFDNQVWNNFFHCSIAFLTQPALQLDTFSQNKRRKIIAKYKDMRREAGFEIRAMWFNLGQYKRQFVPSLIGPFLEMTLIPETELRKATIPIFFDMMQCEYYSSKYFAEKFGDTKSDASQIKRNFNDFENEMIAKLDILVEGGRGDEDYKKLFYEIMLDLCENHSSLREPGVKFVKTVTRLMERLLEYRCIINDENKENRMSCTVNLLDFYSEINRQEMYIRYVYKLCDLHLECDNYTEAAYTLQLHSKLLNWSDQILSPLLKSHKYSVCQTHRELKEALYYSIIDYFDKGKMWECALSVCKELMGQFENETYDYLNLSELLKRMSQFYDSIMKQCRADPEYFRVGYFGRGFPTILQNKVFIYRGKEYERLSDFSSRLLNHLPNAELMNKLTPPGEDILESPNQYLQINKVEPVFDDRKQRFSGKPVNDQILRFYRVNDVQKFKFSRPFQRKDPHMNGEQNEFASLWLERTVLITTYPLPGILRWFPVTSSETFHVSPLRNAIETMEMTNKELKDLIISHKSDPNLPLNSLSLKITGIVDAAVMGGIANYEKAFFTPEYEEYNQDDMVLIQKLKDLIACQIPLLEIALQLHKQRAPHSLLPLQHRLEKCFSDMRANVEEKYGKRICDIKFDNPVTMRRQFTQSSIDNRLSDLSFNLDVSATNGSRVSSLTKSQVNTLKSLATFNFTTNSASNARTNTTQNNKTSILNSTNSKLSLTSPSSSSTIKNKSKTSSKEKRRNSKKIDRESIISLPVTSCTQWYTTSTPENEAISINLSNSNISQSPSPAPITPVFELREELTPHRPLRSEVEKEKRLSRPTSGQFSNSRPPSSIMIRVGGPGSENSSNRDSIGTTDSTTSEDDVIPPPLPIKSRDPDYCNISENMTSSPVNEQRQNIVTTPRLLRKPPLPEPTDDIKKTPPQPPPKPPKKPIVIN